MDNVRYVKTGEGENVRFHQLGAVDNVRYVKTGEGENVRPVKKMRWQMTAYALIGEGENVRGGKCPPFVSTPDKTPLAVFRYICMSKAM